MRRKVVNAISIFVIVTSVLTITSVGLLMHRFWTDKGKTLSLSNTTSKLAAEQAWSGTSANFLVCGIDRTNLLTDVIMVVNFNNQTGKISILQIPRDTYAGEDVVSHKYNAIYGHPPSGVSGMENLKAHIQRDFGISIDYYTSMTTKGFDNIVDAVGGVDLYVPKRLYYNDPYQDLHINLYKGYQHLNGNQAEQFVRDRHDWPEGDIGRLQAQKTFLAAFASKVKKQNVWNITTRLLPAVFGSLSTDMTLIQMGSFAKAADKVSMSGVTVYTVPGEGYSKDNISYFGAYKDKLLDILNESFVKNGVTLTEDDIQVKEVTPTVSTSSAAQGSNFQNLYNSEEAKNPSAPSK